MATYTNLNNEIFANAAIQGLTKILLPFTKFSRNFSPAGAQRGDQVLVPLISTLTATTFGGSYAVCGGTKTVATVNLTKHKVVQVGQSDLSYWASSESNLNDFGKQMGAALGALVLTDILTLCTTANFSAVSSISSTSFSVAELRAARLALNQANVQKDPRIALLDCVPYDVLLGITNFVQAHMFKDSDVLAEGKVNRALGMDFYETNSVFPSTGSVMALFAHPDAIAVGMRYLQPQAGNSYATARAITDPETGLTVGLREHYDNNTGTAYVNLECLYGFTVGLTNCARLIRRLD